MELTRQNHYCLYVKRLKNIEIHTVTHKSSRDRKKSCHATKYKNTFKICTLSVTESDTSCRVFRTAYKIGKHGRPFTDMPVDVRLQELNGVNMG